jgi:hypothetical protein
MSRHRGYGDRSGRKRREVRLDEQRAGTAHAARRDILLRYAITHPTVARLWMCRQQSGRVKPAFRTRAAAVAADALMAQLEGREALRPYECRMAYGREVLGDHWHLASQ